MSKCKYCGAGIKWVETNKGKAMPVDPELVSSDDCDNGAFLVTEDGRVIKIDHGNAKYETTDGFVSHFATCPSANEARRPR